MMKNRFWNDSSVKQLGYNFFWLVLIDWDLENIALLFFAEGNSKRTLLFLEGDVEDRSIELGRYSISRLSDISSRELGISEDASKSKSLWCTGINTGDSNSFLILMLGTTSCVIWS